MGWRGSLWGYLFCTHNQGGRDSISSIKITSFSKILSGYFSNSLFFYLSNAAYSRGVWLWKKRFQKIYISCAKSCFSKISLRGFFKWVTKKNLRLKSWRFSVHICENIFVFFSFSLWNGPQLGITLSFLSFFFPKIAPFLFTLIHDHLNIDIFT